MRLLYASPRAQARLFPHLFAARSSWVPSAFATCSPLLPPTSYVPCEDSGVFFYAQLCALTHWFTSGFRFNVTRAICYPVFAFSVQLTLTHANFVVRYIRSLAFLSVAV